MKQKRIGVIGIGARGSVLAHESIKGTAGLLQPVAVVDPDKKSIQDAGKRYGLTFNSYETIPAMLEAEQLDGIIISSPNNFHLENLKDIARLSIPVLCEKPLEVSWEKISDVIRFSETYKAPIIVGHCMRYAPILNQAKELIISGAIGKVCSSRFVQNCHYGNVMCHGWRRDFKASGGMFIEKATHDIDIMNWLMEAQPLSVFAVSRQQAFGGSRPNDLRCRDCAERQSCPESVQNMLYRWDINVIDEAIDLRENDLCVYAKETTVNDNETCIIQFSNGTFGTYTHAYFTPRSYHHRIYEILGTEGAMEIDLGAEERGKILLCKRFSSAIGDRQEYIFDYMNRNHYNGDGSMMQHFYQVIAGNAKPNSTVKQAYIAEAVGLAAIRSYEGNRNVTIEEILPQDLQYIAAEKLFQGK